MLRLLIFLGQSAEIAQGQNRNCRVSSPSLQLKARVDGVGRQGTAWPSSDSVPYSKYVNLNEGHTLKSAEMSRGKALW